MTETEERWCGRVQEWKASGLSADEFAAGREFKPATLRWWSSRVRGLVGRRRGTGRASQPVRVVRVLTRRRAPATSDSVFVHVGPVRVEVRAGFDRQLLRELVEALEGG